jgi:hypothetical protein
MCPLSDTRWEKGKHSELSRVSLLIFEHFVGLGNLERALYALTKDLFVIRNLII